MSPRPSNLTLPNVLSALRMASVPLLLWLAWTGRGRDYLIVFCVAYATDFLDGQLARRLKQETELGAMLDQVADVLVLLTGPLALWWVWPEILRREAWFIGAVLCLYAASVGCSFAKFGRLATYHAWFGKTATATLAVGSVIAMAGWAAWPFRIGLVLACLACVEEIAITLTLPAAHSNVPTLWQAGRLRRGANPGSSRQPGTGASGRV